MCVNSHCWDLIEVDQVGNIASYSGRVPESGFNFCITHSVQIGDDDDHEEEGDSLSRISEVLVNILTTGKSIHTHVHQMQILHLPAMTEWSGPRYQRVLGSMPFACSWRCLGSDHPKARTRSEPSSFTNTQHSVCSRHSAALTLMSIAEPCATLVMSFSSKHSCTRANVFSFGLTSSLTTS